MLQNSSTGTDVTPPTPNLLVIRSPDIDRAVRFYNQMGLQFERHAHGKGPMHYAVEIGGFVFEIYPLKKGESPLVNLRFGFRVQDLDATIKALREINAEFVSEPAVSPWGRRAVVKDFDGYTIELASVGQDRDA